MLHTYFRGDAANEKVPGLRGLLFFGVDFYCIFGRFGKMTHLVFSKSAGAQAPAAQAGAAPLVSNVQN